LTERYLADACAIVAFFLAEGSTLTAKGKRLMQGEVFVSPITVWELTRKAAIGKLRLRDAVGSSLSGFLAKHDFKMLPLTWDNAESANNLPPIHKDPMDRMLIVQALSNGLTIITEDTIIPHYGVKTVW